MTGIILQARMGSSRLPGKVARCILGRPMLRWTLERLKLATRADALIVATTPLPADDAVVRIAESAGAQVFRGSETDVLDRYYQCARQFELDAIVRATGDNPFVDPVECDRLIDLFVESGTDYACSLAEADSGFPTGVGLEIFALKTLETCWKEGKLPKHREHVNEFIFDQGSRFKTAVLKAPPSKWAPGLNLSVDTEEQFVRAESLYKKYFVSHPPGPVSVEWVVREAAS